MSIKGTTYKELSAILKEKVEGIQWIDMHRGQFDDFSKELPIPSPAITIQFAFGQWKNTGNGTQEGKVKVRFRIGYENYADAFDGSLNQDQALAYFDFMENVHKALQDSAGTYFSKMNRINDGGDEPNGPLLREWMDYELTLADQSAYVYRNAQVVEPEITSSKGDIPEPEEEDPGGSIGF